MTRPRTLMYVSYPSALDPDIEEVLFRVRNSRDLRVRRAQEMDSVLADVANEVRHDKYDRLDLVGHASDEGMELGDFVVAEKGLAGAFLVKLQAALANQPGLQVRFLGCGTPAGVSWLASAKTTLGGRRVHATTEEIDHHDFGPSGFGADGILISR